MSEHKPKDREPIHPGIIHVYALKVAVEHAAFLGVLKGPGVMGQDDPAALAAAVHEIAEDQFSMGGALERHLHECRPCSYEEMVELAGRWLDEHFVPALGIKGPSTWKN